MPVVRGSTAGDSYDIEITFNQSVVVGDNFTWGIEAVDAITTADYKSGNMTNQLTLTVDTSGATTAYPLSLTPVPDVALSAYDTIAGAEVVTKGIAASANAAILNGFPFQVLANDECVTANVVIE